MEQLAPSVDSKYFTKWSIISAWKINKKGNSTTNYLTVAKWRNT